MMAPRDDLPFASQLVMAGTPLRQVQDWLGHSTILMTMRYSHLAPGGGREFLCALDRNSYGNLTATEGGVPHASSRDRLQISASPGGCATLMNLPLRCEPDDTVDDEDVVELLAVA